MQHLDLPEYIPEGWRLIPASCGVRLLAPSGEDACLFWQGARHHLKASADALKATIELIWEGCNEPLRIEGDALPAQPQISSYGASTIAPDAGDQAVLDFVVGRQAEGLIVTIMGMRSDRFLFVNGAQVSDRGGNAETWIGVDAKSLVWGRSLTGTLPGRDRGVNYYAELYRLLERDKSISDFSYCVTRPNGDLHRDVSSYFLIENYLGVPARIAVSRVGDSELVEVAQR